MELIQICSQLVELLKGREMIHVMVHIQTKLLFHKYVSILKILFLFLFNFVLFCVVLCYVKSYVTGSSLTSGAKSQKRGETNVFIFIKFNIQRCFIAFFKSVTNNDSFYVNTVE